jgi:putative membrane protein
MRLAPSARTPIRARKSGGAASAFQTRFQHLKQCAVGGRKMNRLQNHSSERDLLIAVLVALAFAGCGTSQRQQRAVAASVALTPEAAPPRAQHAHSKPLTIRPQTSPVVSTKANTAIVLSQIHQTNLMEIELGKIAEQKASSEEVRAYADQLVQDHMNVDQTVVAMAAKSGANLRNGAKTNQQAAKQNPLERKMKSASGPNFDKLFLQETRSDHETLIRKLQQDREDASDDELEALIDKTIPILQQDQELADVLIKKEKA